MVGWDIFIMEVNLYENICSIENLELAFEKAKKGKSGKLYVIKFESKLAENLEQLHNDLLSYTYVPKPLQTFILRDPKTRRISKSDFRDRIVHHAICNIIEPFFDKTFIYDNYANRVRKGTFKAIDRFDYFKRIVSENNSKVCFVLKADVKHYFDTVNHNVLLQIISKTIFDKRVILLISKILNNHITLEQGKGMPLGNLTSQFFANIYLNELDQFVKHKLKAKYYIRYVDDFVILHENPRVLLYYKEKINQFLTEKLDLELHPDKSRIKTLENGIDFLGFRIFYHYKLVRRKNLNKFERNFNQLKKAYAEDLINREKMVEKFEGWLAYVSYANTYKYRRHLTIKSIYHHL